MSWLTFKRSIFFVVVAACVNGTTFAQQNLDSARLKVEQYKNAWAKAVPRYFKIQYAGSMGLVSVGSGWYYGKNRQWETDVFLGYLPKFETDKTKVTFTLKQNYIPWHWEVSNRVIIDPLTTGLYANTVFGDEFWVSEPEKYGSSYYAFSTKIRFNVFVGQRVTYQFDKAKNFFDSATLFYEFSTSDLYLISRVQNNYLKPSDYIGLSLGVKLEIF